MEKPHPVVAAGEPGADSAAHARVLVEKARFLQRALAHAVDSFILGIVTGVFQTLITPTTPIWWDASVYVLNAAIFGLYYIWPYSTTGQTLGKRLFSIRVAAIDGSPLNWRKALVRTIGYSLSAAPLGLGYLWALWDEEDQAWHDKFAGTCVVPAWVAPEELRRTIAPAEARRRQRRWLLLFGPACAALAAFCWAALNVPAISSRLMESLGASQAAQFARDDHDALLEAVAQRAGDEANSGIYLDETWVGGQAPQAWLTVEVLNPGDCDSSTPAACERLADDLARIVLENYPRVDELTGIRVAIVRYSNFVVFNFTNTLVDKALTVEEWRRELSGSAS
jgi:uncharacterized RDD family membrane protein YckC